MLEENGDGGGTQPPGAGAATTRVKGSVQFIVPPLKPSDRIDEWEPLFRAAVTGLLTQENGQALAIGLLPAHVNRRPAEVELCKEVVTLTTLDEAFTLLKTLDDLIDKYEMMQQLCRAEWVPGTAIDDFYYLLKEKGNKAGANLDLIMSIVIAQLPKKIQRVQEPVLPKMWCERSLSNEL